MSDTIYYALSSIIGTGDPGDPYRPEVADAVNRAGRPMFGWTAIGSGFNGTEDDRVPIGTMFFCALRPSPTTVPGEPLPPLENTSPLASSVELNAKMHRVSSQYRGQLRDALLRRDINPARYLNRRETVRSALLAILGTFKP